jgi:hypothetical protein
LTGCAGVRGERRSGVAAALVAVAAEAADFAGGARSCPCLRGTVAAARSSARASRAELGYLPRLCGALFPSSGGGRIDISNFRHRGWTRAAEGGLGQASPRLRPASHVREVVLAAGVDIYTLSRRMGTSLQMIDRTYGHLAAGADVWERELLDGFDQRGRSPDGRYFGAENEEEEKS